MSDKPKSPYGKDSPVVTVRVDDALRQAVLAEAERRHTSMAGLVRGLVRDGLASSEASS